MKNLIKNHKIKAYAFYCLNSGGFIQKRKFFFFGNIKTRVASEDFRFSACEKSDFSHYLKKESFDLRLPINNHSQSSE